MADQANMVHAVAPDPAQRTTIRSRRRPMPNRGLARDPERPPANMPGDVHASSPGKPAAGCVMISPVEAAAQDRPACQTVDRGRKIEATAPGRQPAFLREIGRESRRKAGRLR
jgi:hypothetical protein